MRRSILFALALYSCFLLASCGGSSPTSTSPVAGSVPVSLSIGDTPPDGVAVLFFEAMITGVKLQPSDSSKPAVSVLASPVEVEFGHLQTDTAFLSLFNTPPDTYSSMTLTFNGAQMTIVNHTGAAIGSCGNNSVCEFSPNFNSSTATISSSPFPIQITPQSVVGVRLDFNLISSIQTDLSVTPTVAVNKLIIRQQDEDDQEMEQLDEVEGVVTATGNNQFTLMNKRSGQSFTITVDNNTFYEDFDRAGCTANPVDFTCIQTGQVLNVRLSENGMGSMLAKRVEFEEKVNTQAIKGTITSVDSATQFHMVVFNEEPNVNGLPEGSPAVVTIMSSATFQIGKEETGEDQGFGFSNLSFVSGADLMVGQDVQVRAQNISTINGTPALTTDLVRLWPSQVTGQIGTVNSDNGTFTLVGLSPLFTGANPPVTKINVISLSEMDFMDFTGSGSLVPGSTVSVKGLLFDTPTTPTLVTRAMREHHDD